MCRLLPAAAAAVAMALVGAAIAQSIQVSGRTELRDRFVVTERDAYCLMPPELVAGPRAVSAWWSPDGRYALVVQLDARSDVRSEAPVAARLIVWNRRAHQADTAWRWTFPGPDRERLRVSWLTGTTTALVTIPVASPANREGGPEARHEALLRVDAARASAAVMLDAEWPAYFAANVSPTRPLALVHQVAAADQPGGTQDMLRRRTRSALRLLRTAGPLGPPIPLPDVGSGGVEWAEDGASPVVAWMARGEDRKVTRSYFALDAGTGRLSPLAAEPKLYDASRAADESGRALTLQARPASASISEGGTKRRLRPVWLEATVPASQPRVLVTPDAAWSDLSPRGDAVLYCADGAAWMAPVTQVSRAAYDQMAQQAAMQDAKTVSLALMMYVQDYDAKFPLSEHVSGGSLYPYAKDPGAFDGFTYLYPGEKLGDIRLPAEALMGYVTVPGGRAAMYVDGHVKWEPGGAPGR